VGVQIRSDDPEVAGWVDFLNHEATRAATGAERAFLRRVEGGCQVPVGAYGQIQAGVLSLRAMVCSLDGASSVEGERSARPDEAGELGLGLAEEVLDRGGREILDAIGRGEDEG
jgi:hydroxymethylbilane synthase